MNAKDIKAKLKRFEKKISEMNIAMAYATAGLPNTNPSAIQLKIKKLNHKSDKLKSILDATIEIAPVVEELRQL